jgi:hypothetical protein
MDGGAGAFLATTKVRGFGKAYKVNVLLLLWLGEGGFPERRFPQNFRESAAFQGRKFVLNWKFVLNRSFGPLTPTLGEHSLAGEHGGLSW